MLRNKEFMCYRKYRISQKTYVLQIEMFHTKLQPQSNTIRNRQCNPITVNRLSP